jgi:hypothetical protein
VCVLSIALQLRACPAPLLVACLDAVAVLGLRPAGAWEEGLWSALGSRAARMGLKVSCKIVRVLLVISVNVFVDDFCSRDSGAAGAVTSTKFEMHQIKFMG